MSVKRAVAHPTGGSSSDPPNPGAMWRRTLSSRTAPRGMLPLRGKAGALGAVARRCLASRSLVSAADRDGDGGRQGGTAAQWPEQSFVFEPVWEPSSMPRPLLIIPNMLETYSCLREAQRKLKVQGVDLKSIDDINMHFMDRFLQLHHDAEVSRMPRRGGSMAVRGGSPAGPSRVAAPGRLDLASARARSTWTAERPLQAHSWELTPLACQVVQSRRAEHHSRDWLQVTTRLTAQERWALRGGHGDSRIREHYVVYEMPRDVPSQAFRISAIRPNLTPQ